MKTGIKVIVTVLLIVICFMLSGLFFMSSGMINEDTGELNEWRAVQIVNDLDKIPFVNIDEVTFDSWGEISVVTNDTFILETHDGVKSFMYVGNLSEFNDSVRVEYEYSADGAVVVLNVSSE